ncbi:type IV pilin [Methanosarcina sp. Mfa9]|uniref:type IV pilin n=1 Tax=Methanosarcina sp. Mfa9 TaxID=3439063 RepID=UPI003F833A81
MDLKNIFKKDDAVSPVIGVVLMVAITVILAAAIGSSVFGQGPSESAPQANVDIIVVDNEHIKLEHLGGDTIVVNDNSTTRIMIANESAGTSEINISQFDNDYFDVGETQVLNLSTGNGTNFNLAQSNGEFVTVKIVDVKTKQLIADKELRF